MDQILINVLNGVSSGLLLFMLSSGLTLIFSMMGVLNFAHASFYMIGAYFAHTLTRFVGFWPALVFAPIGVRLLGALFETTALRRVHKLGHVAELLITFGLSFVVLELVQIVWGRTPVAFDPPAFLQGPAFTVVQSADGLSLALGAAQDAVCHAAKCSRFPMTRAFMMFVALAMLVGLWLLLTRTRIGLVIQAPLTHPEMAEALEPQRAARVHAGVRQRLRAGGPGRRNRRRHLHHRAQRWQPWWAPIIFVVVVVGGMGSLAGAFIASLLIGLLQTLPLTVDSSVADAVNSLGGHVDAKSTLWPLLRITLARGGADPAVPAAGADPDPAAARAVGHARRVNVAHASEHLTRRDWIVWVVFALVLLVVPLLWRSSFAQTMLSQIGIAIIACLASQHAARPGWHAELRACGVQRAGLVHRDSRAQHGLQGPSRHPVSLMPLVGGPRGLVLRRDSWLRDDEKSGTTFAMITLGIGELVASMSLMIPEFFGGEGGIQGNRVFGKPVLGITFGPQIQVYYLIAVYCFISTAAMYALTRTPLGRMLNRRARQPRARGVRRLQHAARALHRLHDLGLLRRHRPAALAR